MLTLCAIMKNSSRLAQGNATLPLHLLPPASLAQAQREGQGNVRTPRQRREVQPVGAATAAVARHNSDRRRQSQSRQVDRVHRRKGEQVLPQPDEGGQHLGQAQGLRQEEERGQPAPAHQAEEEEEEGEVPLRQERLAVSSRLFVDRVLPPPLWLALCPL